MIDSELQLLLLMARMLRALWMARMQGEDDVAQGELLDQLIKQVEQSIEDGLE